jgi:hypothetical protein
MDFTPCYLTRVIYKSDEIDKGFGGYYERMFHTVNRAFFNAVNGG